MRLFFPKPSTPVAQGGAAPFDREWLGWLRRTWESLGWSPSVPVFSNQYFHGCDLEHVAGDTSTITISDAVYAPQFIDTGTNVRAGGLLLPNNYVAGTDVSPYIDWAPADVLVGAIVMRFAHGVVTPDAVAVQTATESKTLTTPGVQNHVTKTIYTDIDGADLNKNDIIPFSISRMGDDAADLYGDDISVFGVGFAYQVEGLGQEVAIA